MKIIVEEEKEIAPEEPITELIRIRKVMFSRWVVVLGLIIIVILVVVALAAPLLAPYDPNVQNLSNILKPPSSANWLGTDDLGRDTLSRLIYGSQVSLLVGIVAVTIAAVIGVFLGLLAGYFGKWVGTIIMRGTDTLMSIPPLILMLVISAILGIGLKSVLIAIGVGLIPTYTRLIYGQVLSVKENDYVTAAHIIGASDGRIMLHHLIPNSFPPLLVLITTNLGSAIMAEAALSFLGIGVAPGTPAWGTMVNIGYKYLRDNPLLSFAPGAAIFLVVLAFNMIGDGLRDALDPRLRGII